MCPSNIGVQECSWNTRSFSEEGNLQDDQPQEQWAYKSEPVAGQFIVRFRDYKMAADHKQALIDKLGMAAQWKYVDRNNAAARFPTDFALLEIDLGAVEAIKVCLSSHREEGRINIHCPPYEWTSQGCE